MISCSYLQADMICLCLVKLLEISVKINHIGVIGYCSGF